jgi:predicted TIM-barrel fold metal-dependent hydrolase
MKIDVFPHIIPKRYKEALYQRARGPFFGSNWIDAIPTLTDLDFRFRIMDRHEGYVQVLTLGNPPLEKVVSPKDAVELAKMANDEMAELVTKYPDRFVAAVASLPMNDIDAALKEIDRAIVELKHRGIQIHTPLNGKPLDSPEFLPFFEKMAHYNLPTWIHPLRDTNVPDYAGERSSKYLVFSIFGWPYETTVAMTRLVFSGLFDKYINLKVITHHSGGMVPYFAERIVGFHDINEMHLNFKYALKQRPIDYYRLFYNDTAVYGNTPALMCCYAFFGAEHMLFGTDMPYDNEFGFRYVRQTIDAIGKMHISDAEKGLIFEGNAKKLLGINTTLC